MSTRVPNIVSTHNSPIVGLQQQLNQIRLQSNEYSEHDKNVIGFNNKLQEKDEEIKLYVPVETFDNYRNINRRSIYLFIFIIIILIIFYFR